MRFSVIAGIVFIASLTPSLSNAVEYDDAIIVTASRLDKDIQSQPATITVINAEDIQNSTASNLPDLLSLEAGINTRHFFGGNSARPAVDIRGFGLTGTQNTLILLDGRRLNDIDLSPVDFNAIPLHNIARIEITRGSGGVLYGDGAVGGTINIITKTPGKTGTTGNVAVFTGSYENYGINANVSHVQGAFSFNIAASSEVSDAYRDNNEYREDVLQGDFRYTRDDGEIYLKFGADQQHLNFPGVRSILTATGINQYKTDRRGATTPRDYAERDGYYTTAGVSRYLGDSTELIVDVGYRNKMTESFFDDYVTDAFDVRNYRDVYLNTWSITPRINSELNLLGVPGTLNIGIDYYDSDYEQERSLIKSTSNTPVHRVNIDQERISVYARHLFRPSPRTRINVGARWQRIATDARDSYDATAPGAAFGAEKPDNNEQQHLQAYELGIAHDVTNETTVYANVNQAFRVASIDEIYSEFAAAFVYLNPQTSRGIDIGVKFRNQHTKIQAAAYYMSLKNELHFDITQNSGFGANVNLDPTKRYGFELTADHQLNKQLGLRFNYALTRSRFREGILAGNDVPAVPGHTASLTALWQIMPRLDLSATANYVGSRFLDNDQTNDFYKKVPAMTTVDVKLTGKWASWKVSGLVNNLFDKKYYDYGIRSTSVQRYNVYPLPERNALVTISKGF
ncbi:MAG: TonB-dependent receptor [Gammaproteobacteria bacterium]|nr:MAG: TonB-dependent receptor [Gammaproteobacteria bacterium]